ncbi:MAG TPA: contractile injection system protein, VgrG/Pvc8 family [Pyrinomonadaceae bacterium]|jgi:phage protein D|nr:contractile injection system protein, VgrG/Pvc8 family [Pyrinomonadaceae bacterium]
MTEALYSATAPVFEVEEDVKQELGRDLVRLEVSETTSGLKTLSARFKAIGNVEGSAQQGQLYLDGTIVDFGKKLDVSIGPGPEARTIFEGYISGLEAIFKEGADPQIVVFAEDKLMSLRMTHRMKTYKQVTDADIAQAIASEHGLQAQVDAEGPTYDVVHQWNMSDLAFLRERARKIQAEIWFGDNALNFKTRDKRTATELTLVQGNELIELQARADLAHQRTKVKVSGYDASQREGVDEEAGSDAIQAEVSDGRTGPSVLERAFGERISYRVREAPLTTAEARDWARAEMLRRSRGFVTAIGTTRSSPDMIVGSKLTFQGAGRSFDGAGYYAISVRHTYDLKNGHRTHFVAERATIQEGA